MRARLTGTAIALAWGSIVLAGCTERPTEPPVATKTSLQADISTSTASGYLQVSAGGWFTCAVRTDGSLACWGRNDYGQAVPPAGSNFAQVGAGLFHACAVRTDGSLACWGGNDHGQATPLAGNNFAQVSGGAWHTCALKTDGSLACWGYNGFGQTTPPAGTDFVRVSAGSWHNCANRADRSLACWGDNDFGQIIPPPGNNFAQVDAGSEYTCALRTDGSLACWGANFLGRLDSPAGTNFAQVSSGGSPCALKTDGSLACWGSNDSGQATPPAGTNFTQVSGGVFHSCALRTDAALVCWGANGYGQATPPPVTPQAAIQLLMVDVRTLVSEGVLKPGQRDGLLAKLAAAIPSLDGGRTNAACNQLQAFVNQVSGLVRAKQLSAAAGQELIDAAESVRSQIGCAAAAGSFSANAILSSDLVAAGSPVPYMANFGRRFSFISEVDYSFVFGADPLDPGECLTFTTEDPNVSGFGVCNTGATPQTSRLLTFPCGVHPTVCDLFRDGSTAGQLDASTYPAGPASVNITSLTITVLTGGQAP